jgi:hypothetical protein
VFGLAPLRATLARGSLVAGFSDRVAFLLVLPTLAATSGAGAPTVATGPNSRPHSKSGGGMSIGTAVTRSISAWIVIAYVSAPKQRVIVRMAQRGT